MGRKLNPNQFKLFYGATELQKSITESGDQYGEETLNDMWKRKINEAKLPPLPGEHGSGVYDSIAQKGYQGEPLNLSHESYWDGTAAKHIDDGHHRLASSADIEKKTGRNIWIPVKNQSDTHYNLNGTNPPMSWMQPHSTNLSSLGPPTTSDPDPSNWRDMIGKQSTTRKVKKMKKPGLDKGSL